VAQAILRGVEKNRFAIAPGWQMALLYRATNPFAGVIRRRLDHLARRASAKP
jgi:hypothetical protein